MNITPSVAVNIIKKSSKSISNSNTLYVGGTGEGNYTRIQDAIDNASDGDKIFVYSGIYNERIKVNKSLYLKGIDTGEGKPIVDGNKNGKVIRMQASGSTLDNFNVQNAGTQWDDNAGIHLSAKYCTISNNTCGKSSYTGIYIIPDDKANRAKITNNTVENAYIFGIYMPYEPTGGSKHMNISFNTIINNPDGIELNSCSHNILYRNNISSNNRGILIRFGGYNEIIENIISNNDEWGLIIFQNSNENIIKGNHVFSNNYQGIFLNQNYETKIVVTENLFENNKYGLRVLVSTHGLIYYNIFIGNEINGYQGGADSQWDNDYPFGGNFWDDYTDKDVYHGKLQNKLGSDGIGDKSYVKNGVRDSYPLMFPHKRNIVNMESGKAFNTIQEAIDNSKTKDGHTIWVLSGTYHQNLNIYKKLTFIGEETETTKIIGDGINDIFKITADEVSISKFTIKNNNYSLTAGINISSSSNIISNCMIDNNQFGVYCDGINNRILHNHLSDNKYGIIISSSNYPDEAQNRVSFNTLVDNSNGILIRSSNNHIIRNTIINHDIGIQLRDTQNEVVYNEIEKNSIGIQCLVSSDNNIHHNNFKNNSLTAYDSGQNLWNDTGRGNYWSDYNGSDNNSDGIGDIPYNITGGDNKDYYPLMNPYSDNEKPSMEIFSPISLFIYIFDLEFLFPLPITLIIGFITLLVDVSDKKSGVNRVEFFIDDELVGVDYEPPRYEYFWSKVTKRNPLPFIHIIKFVGYDNFDNFAEEEIAVRRFL